MISWCGHFFWWKWWDENNFFCLPKCIHHDKQLLLLWLLYIQLTSVMCYFYSVLHNISTQWQITVSVKWKWEQTESSHLIFHYIFWFLLRFIQCFQIQKKCVHLKIFQKWKKNFYSIKHQQTNLQFISINLNSLMTQNQNNTEIALIECMSVVFFVKCKCSFWNHCT